MATIANTPAERCALAVKAATNALEAARLSAASAANHAVAAALAAAEAGHRVTDAQRDCADEADKHASEAARYCRRTRIGYHLTQGAAEAGDVFTAERETSTACRAAQKAEVAEAAARFCARQARKLSEGGGA